MDEAIRMVLRSPEVTAQYADALRAQAWALTARLLAMAALRREAGDAAGATAMAEATRHVMREAGFMDAALGALFRLAGVGGPQPTEAPVPRPAHVEMLEANLRAACVQAVQATRGSVAAEALPMRLGIPIAPLGGPPGSGTAH